MFPLPHILGWQTIRTGGACKARLSEPLDQPRIDQQTIEPSRFGSAGASVEQPLTTPQHVLLFGKRRIQRHTRRLLHQQWQIRCIEGLERRRYIDRSIVYRVDSVVARVVARIEGPEQTRDGWLAERRIDDAIGKFRLMIAEANDQERIGRKVMPEPRKQ